MAAFKVGEPCNHYYGDVTVNIEGKQLKIVEGFLVKIKKKDYVVTSISCVEGDLRVRISDYKVLALLYLILAFLEKGQFS